MNASFLSVPFFMIRFALLDGETKQRASAFAPLSPQEKPAFLVYQLATLLLLLAPLFLRIRASGAFFYFGMLIYSLGLLLLYRSLRDFARPNRLGLNQEGIYRYSRNPMYAAYFVYFLSYVILTQSVLLLLLLIVFQIASHWIIVSEERWCLKQFGKAYETYMQMVRRYL